MFPLKINNYVGLFYYAKYVSGKIAVELHMKRKEKENSINEKQDFTTFFHLNITPTNLDSSWHAHLLSHPKVDEYN